MFPVNIEVRDPVELDSDDDDESVEMTPDDSGDEAEEEADYQIVLKYRVEQFQEMFQMMSLKRDQLKNAIHQSTAEIEYLKDMNKGLKEKLAVASSGGESSISQEDRAPRKRSRVAHPEEPISSGVLNIDEEPKFRSVDFSTIQETDEDCMTPCTPERKVASSSHNDVMNFVMRTPPKMSSVATQSSGSKLESSRPAPLNVTPEKDDDDPHRIQHTRSMTEDKVLTPSSAAKKGFHRRSASVPAMDLVPASNGLKPEIHVFKKRSPGSGSNSKYPVRMLQQKSASSRAILTSTRAPIVEDKVWRTDVEQKIQQLKAMHNNVKMSVAKTAETVLNVGVESGANMLARTVINEDTEDDEM